MKITSFSNPRIKEIVKLRQRRHREEKHLTIIEGVREFKRAVQAKIQIIEIYFCQEFYSSYQDENVTGFLKKNKGLLFDVKKEVFQKIAYGQRHEGILALAHPPQNKLSNIKQAKDFLFVVIENIEKPGNLGAILRTCDGAGVHGVFISNFSSDVYGPKVIRSSLGAVFNLPVFIWLPEKILQFFKKSDISILATTPNGESLYTQCALKKSLAIVLGSEHTGLSSFWLNSSDIQARIPMLGEGDSLNVSQTAAILIYEAVRQKGID